MPAPRGVFALLVSFVVTCAATSATLPPGLAPAGVAWQPSHGFVVAEVMTGGASASDEYVEVANAGATAADLGGCELVYASASGATVTRKANFTTPLVLAPGQHLLVANAAGIYGPLADATYSGGLAADGGAVALRLVNGAVIDSVGWGTATNSFVEGSAAQAPPAGSSLERLPGGSNGNTQDDNDNRADWFVQPHPVPQSLASLPTPGPTPTPTLTDPPTESAPADTATDTPTPSDAPTPTDTPTDAPTPTDTPTATPSASGGATPTPTITTGPSASPTPEKTTTTLQTIASARAQSVGARVHVAGIVTAAPGVVGADGLFTIQDASGAIFVRVSTAPDGLVEGSSVEVEGTLAAPYGQLEIREVSSISVGPGPTEPDPSQALLGDIGEPTEGTLVAIAGTVESVATDSGRLTIVIGDGIHSVHLLADPPTGLSRTDVARGYRVVATGIVGQRATATGRLDGYRVWLRRRADLVVSVPVASPSASHSPAHSASYAVSSKVPPASSYAGTARNRPSNPCISTWLRQSRYAAPP